MEMGVIMMVVVVVVVVGAVVVQVVMEMGVAIVVLVVKAVVKKMDIIQKRVWMTYVVSSCSSDSLCPSLRWCHSCSSFLVGKTVLGGAG